MKTKAIFISLIIVTFLFLLNMAFASQQIIWDTATTEVVLTPGTDLWEDDGVEGPYVMYDNGVYKMWYRGRGTKPNPMVEYYEDAIGYATSTDGVNWSNRQLVYGPMPGYPQTKSPSVIKEGATYRMWLVDYYESIGGQWSGYVTHMDSTDGVMWNNQQKIMSAQGQVNPQGDGYNIESVCVLDEGSQYTMWYEVADLAAPYREKIWRATSADGINWGNRQLSLPYGQETWEYRVKRPDVVSDGQGGYTMYYTVASEVGFWQLAMATSEDGITWNNRQLLGISGADPSYFEDVDGTPYLYFDEGGQILRMSGNRVSDPTANAGPDQTVDADSGCTATITLDGSNSSDPDEDIVLFEWFTDGTAIGTGETLIYEFSLGVHTVTLVVTDGFGETDTDEVVITVEDTTPPEISLSVSKDHLWPPKHQMVDVGFSYSVSDNCDADPDVSFSISSDEPTATELDAGGAHFSPDAQINDDFLLRAERCETGDGRVYVIKADATDDSGNTSTQGIPVKANIDKKTEAIDSGQNYDATTIN